MGLNCCIPVHEVRGSIRYTLRSLPLQTIYCSRSTVLRYIDPTLEHDLTSQTKPWALSPLITTMPHFAHQRIGESDSTPPEFPPRKSLVDNNSHLSDAVEDPTERKNLSLANIQTADQRRTHFTNKDARKSITFGPNVGPAQMSSLSPSVPRGRHN